jgi:hypothetical protein
MPRIKVRTSASDLPQNEQLSFLNLSKVSPEIIVFRLWVLFMTDADFRQAISSR